MTSFCMQGKIVQIKRTVLHKTGCSAANIVLWFLKEYHSIKISNNDLITGFALCHVVLNWNGLVSLYTIRANRIADCPLKCGKDLKKGGLGSSSYISNANSGIVLVRWFHKSIQLVSTYSSPDTSGTVKRQDQSSKRHILVPCSEITKD